MATEYTLRAGLCSYNEETKECKPIATQGLITLQPNEDEEMGFWEFQWKSTERNRTVGAENISLILIPGETVWRQLKSCQYGRVFALVFSSNEKYVFWLQEKVPVATELNANDKRFCDKINSLLTLEADEEMDDEDKEKNHDDSNEKDDNLDIIMANASA